MILPSCQTYHNRSAKSGLFFHLNLLSLFHPEQSRVYTQWMRSGVLLDVIYRTFSTLGYQVIPDVL